MDIQIVVILIVIVIFYCLTPGILINIKGNKYAIALTHAALFSVIILLIQNIFVLSSESFCPAVPECVEKTSFRNSVWPWGKADGTPDNGAGEWTGCAPRTIASTGQSPNNTVYKKDGKTTARCPKINNVPLRAFPYLIWDAPGTKGQNAQVDLNAISKMNTLERPCMYKLDQFCGFAEAYDKNGNIIVGTEKNPPQCGSHYDRPTRILENSNLLACLSDPPYQSVNGNTVLGNVADPLFDSIKTGGIGSTYYVTN
jgi:hypothetical protein